MTKKNAVNDSIVTEGNDPDHDIFTDPALSSGLGRDPVAEFIKAQWRPLLITVLVALAIVYIKNSWQESYQRNIEASADAFFKAQDALEQLKADRKKLRDLEAAKEKDEKAIEAAQSEVKAREERLQQTLAILGDSKEPYNKLADILRALQAHEKGDIKSVKAALAQYSTESLPKLAGSNKFVAELALMTLGRALLDSAGTEAEGKNILTALAKHGETVPVSAVLTLSRIAATEQEKKDAAALVTELSARFPEQAAALSE